MPGTRALCPPGQWLLHPAPPAVQQHGRRSTHECRQMCGLRWSTAWRHAAAAAVCFRLASGAAGVLLHSACTHQQPARSSPLGLSLPRPGSVHTTPLSTAAGARLQQYPTPSLPLGPPAPAARTPAKPITAATMLMHQPTSSLATRASSPGRARSIWNWRYERCMSVSGSTPSTLQRTSPECRV